jgi:VIT1/CCC1 family predicted Fe2+/Mn2+ transporter
MHKHSVENHKITNAGFLRAAVLGANDGLISTSSLIVGVAASGLSEQQIVTTSFAALIAGAMSMAAGEYISVSSQADTEKADIKKERAELEEYPEAELKELEEIYISRGLSSKLAKDVALELTHHNALAAHCRDELGIIDVHRANPLQAALASAVMFAVGATPSILVIFLVDLKSLVFYEAIVSVLTLLIMGAVTARTGGADMKIGAARVAFWGAAAMAFTAVVGHLFGAVVV